MVEAKNRARPFQFMPWYLQAVSRRSRRVFWIIDFIAFYDIDPTDLRRIHICRCQQNFLRMELSNQSNDDQSISRQLLHWLIFFKIAQKSSIFLGYFCKRIICRNLSKIAHSGHTDQDVLRIHRFYSFDMWRLERLEWPLLWGRLTSWLKGPRWLNGYSSQLVASNRF